MFNVNVPADTAPEIIVSVDGGDPVVYPVDKGVVSVETSEEAEMLRALIDGATVEEVNQKQTGAAPASTSNVPPAIGQASNGQES